MFKPLLYHHSHLLLNVQWFTMIPLLFNLIDQQLIRCITDHMPHDKLFILCISAVNVSGGGSESQYQSDRKKRWKLILIRKLVSI
jgi:hypothetical protein